MKKTLIIVAFFSFLFSCKKTSTNDAVAETSLDITVANLVGNYKMTAATVTSNGLTIDAFNTGNYIDACVKDDIISYTASGGFTVQDLGTKCSPTSAVTAGSYTLVSSTLTLNGTDIYSVQKITSQKIVLSQSFLGSVIVFTYTRQ